MKKAKPTTQATINSFFAKRIPAKRTSTAIEKENKEQKLETKINETPIKPKILNEINESSNQTADPIPNSESIPYADLCAVFQSIEETTKRLQIQALLTAFFKKIISDSTPRVLIECVYLSLNRIGPEYEGKELGIGEGLLVKAIASSTGRKPSDVKKDVAIKGDLGLVAQTSRSTQKLLMKPKPLTVSFVFESLKKIANFTGGQSQQRKVDLIQKMLISCNGNESKYLIRSLEGKLRIGLAQQTILISLTHAIAAFEEKYQKGNEAKKQQFLIDAVAIVKQVFSTLPSYDIIIPALLDHGIENLQQNCQLTPGIPLKPMLAHPTKSLTDVLNRFENMAFTCEYKYDGERAQIHRLEDGSVKVYSRNSEDLSEKYPDIIARIPGCLNDGVSSFVLDCEAVAWDVGKKCILPFQVLSTRKRKDVSEDSIQVQVCVFAFDLLYLNNKALVKDTLKNRRELLLQSFHEVEGQFCFAKGIDSTAVEDIQTFLDASIVDNCEGLMVKTLEKDSSYEPSKRSRNWLKVKKDYVNGLGDSLDLVVIGAYSGRGKRTGAYGGYLLACYDDENEEYQSICKIGTGFSDQDLANQFQQFKDHILDKKPAYYSVAENPNISPDVWFKPAVVWEVKAADLSISPVHKAACGLVDPDKGISLRFPRYVRLRDDKSPEDATTAEQVAEFYQNQNINHAELQDE